MEDITFFKEGDIDYPSFFSDEAISAWLKIIATHYQKTLGTLTFIFCDDEYILSVNKQYLQHDYYTDVITFDYCEDDTLSGDIFISLDTVESNSKEYETIYENEFHRVVCHAMLHLIGFKDKTDEEDKIMRLNENTCLDLLKTL